MRDRAVKETLRRMGCARRQVQEVGQSRPLGELRAVRAPVVEALLPGVRVGTRCQILGSTARVAAEVIAVRAGVATLLLHAGAEGLRAGTPVSVLGEAVCAVGDSLLGRVVDPRSRPLDGGPVIDRRTLRPGRLDADPPPARSRLPVDRPLWTGVRVIDACCTLGRGQRVGLIAPAGTGKSRLVARIAMEAEAEVVVVALVGERGRELQEWMRDLPDAARARTVTVAATSDAPAHLRAQAALYATAVAEHFRAAGREVLLIVDSLTRHLRACREIALAAGEDPGPSGYPPSTLAALPRLLERAGNDARGRMTALYTVLEENTGSKASLEEEVRSLLDGHLILSRALAERGHYPAIDPIQSVSRVADSVVDETHQQAADRLRALVRAYEDRRELMVLGAWEPGRDAEGDEALARWPAIEAFLKQSYEVSVSASELRDQLCALLR